MPLDADGAYVFPPVKYAGQYGKRSDQEIIQQSETMMQLVDQLALTLATEGDVILAKCKPHVQATLTQGDMVDM